MRVVLGDLRHKTVGRHSSYMPIAIGYIGSYLNSRFPEGEINVSIHIDADELREVIARDKPDVVGLSNYVWNAQLSRAIGQYAKQLNPLVVVIAGGPEFPAIDTEISEYLRERCELDFFVANFEGEVPFAELLLALHDGIAPSTLKQAPPPGVCSIDNEGLLHRGSQPPRLKDLDVIPSPILSGMMDQFLNGEFMPFIETTRGCPYACAYCVQGVEWFNKISIFSSARVKAELEYISERIAAFPDIPLAMADSNFGMYPRDEETAEILNGLMESRGWPRSFIVDTGKSQLQRLLRVAEKLNKRIAMSLSPQSLNPETLAAISRKNLGDKDPLAVYEEFKRRNISTSAAVIVPLPEETKQSYIEGLRKLSRSNVEQPLAYTTMLLRGTALASTEARQKYSMQTKYRMLPRAFGEYGGNRIFEYDEVCIATNTMSFSDYVDCRSVVFAFIVLTSMQFDVFKLHCADHGLEWFDFLLEFYQAARADHSPLREIFAAFDEETRGELFDSPEAIQAFIDNDENYRLLLSGELGNNAIRKLTPLTVLDDFPSTCRLGYEVLARMLPAAREELAAAQDWCLAVRSVASVVYGGDDEARSLSLAYDVPSWYEDRGENMRLADRAGTITVQVEPAETEAIHAAVEIVKRMYGSHAQIWASRLLEMKQVSDMWRRCRRITAHN